MGALSYVCWRCKGIGTIPVSDVSGGSNQCNVCEGSGSLPHGMVDNTDIIDAIADLANKVEDVMNKCNDIKEAVDAL